MGFDSGINNRYKIRDIQFTGTLYSMDGVIPYKTGTGCFRNILVETAGKFDGDRAYVPVTVFGADAQERDPVLDKGRKIDVTACLTSRKYEWDGKIRWSLSLPAVSVQLGPRVTLTPPEPENPVVQADDPAVDDLPF